MGPHEMTDRIASVTAGLDALQAIERAVSLLRLTGFELAYTSMKSEACYYGRSSWAGVIRVAAHRWGRTAQRALTMPVASHITFGSDQGRFSPAEIERRTCEAIGRYTLARARAEQVLEGLPM
jgi:hypothetical protein